MGEPKTQLKVKLSQKTVGAVLNILRKIQNFDTLYIKKKAIIDTLYHTDSPCREKNYQCKNYIWLFFLLSDILQLSILSMEVSSLGHLFDVSIQLQI